MRNAAEMKLYVGFSVLAAVLSLVTAAAYAEEPQQFATVSEMIEDRADFSEELGTYKLISANPLHIQLAAQVVANDLPEVVLSEVQRAAIYGVYRTFIHTDADKVRVTAVPMEVTMNPWSGHILKSPVVDIEVTRAQSLKAVASKIPASSLNDLVELTSDSDSWSKPFAQLYFKPEGQAAIVKALSRQK